MADKMFKKSKNLLALKDYSQHIEDSLKPLGFGESADQTFYDIKLKLFNMLYQETLTSGESFDAEILFTSLISDLNQTFDEVGPSLLQLQREKYLAGDDQND